MQPKYYIVIEGKQAGPFSLEELADKNLTPDSLVWKAGLKEWVKASTLPEIAGYIVVEEAIPEPPEIIIEEERIWFAMTDNGRKRIGPLTIDELISSGIEPTTPVWRNGMADWQEATMVSEVMDRLNKKQHHYYNEPPRNPFSQNQGYGAEGNQETYGHRQDQRDYYNGHQRKDFTQNPYYDERREYRQTYYNGRPNDNGTHFRTNWLPWAIGATIVGFFFSCIGAIFGIIGIVQANKANSLYSMGDYHGGDQVNNNAKTMTIIGYVLAGVGLIIGISLQGALGSFGWWS